MPMPLPEHGNGGDAAHVPVSAWSMRSADDHDEHYDEHHHDAADHHVDPDHHTDDHTDHDDDQDGGTTTRLASFPDDQDSIDTAPTRIEAEAHSADVPEEEPEPASGPPSGRHAAIVLEEPATAQTALRLAHDDPYQAPEGYPVKADTTTGVYWTPGSGTYDRARAEIWFASEEFALTNGFVKG
jgi:uncharacterized protein with LGFP repeats